MEHCDPEDLALIALGEQPDADDAVHLVTCETCRTEWESLRETVALARRFPGDAALTAPPPEVWKAVTESMSQPSNVSSMRASRRWAPWIAVAAAAGVLFGGVAGVALVRSPQQVADIVASAPLAPLEGYVASGTATIERVEGSDMLAVNVTGMPATDGYYEVWLLAPDASSMIAIGTLGAGTASTFPLPAGVSLADYPTVDISAEAYDGNPAHSADSIMRGTLPA